MTLADSLPPPAHWKFSQVFGERAPGEEILDGDVISAIEFDRTGDHLAVGDKGGRVVIFRRTDKAEISGSRKELEKFDFSQSRHPQFHFKTEFQSHEPEFDYLKSVEIEEKINKVKWCTTPNGPLRILSTNDKTIKLWKIKEHTVKKVNKADQIPHVSSENMLLAERSFEAGQHQPAVSNGYHLEWTDMPSKGSLLTQEENSMISAMEDNSTPICRKVYAHAHDFNINSISTNSDGETFISADDLRINVWNMEISNQCFNIIDMKPSNMEDLTEVITSAVFHPSHCNVLAYSSTRGFIRLVDMRKSALCDHSARILKDQEANGSKSLFTEIISAISDVKFTYDGIHILSRDYMSLKLWDTRKESSPAAIYKVHEHLRPKLSDLYNDDTIFDKFDCCVSGRALHFATGSYSNHLRVFSCGVGHGEGGTVEVCRNGSRKSSVDAAPRRRRSSLSNLTRGFSRHGRENSVWDSIEASCDMSSKILHMAWHPTANLIACSTGNSLFTYYA
uniref:Serine/threonine-protein phosphatase 2A 55 kDa regulatory subunit B n=1 Tax=Kalanchoe fedtschenkoi TaxID=63787 RepID=A0A7N0V3L0_KALFE